MPAIVYKPTLTMMGVESLVPAIKLYAPPRRNAVRVQVKRGDTWHDITSRVHRGQVRHNNDDPIALLDLTLLNGTEYDSLAPRVKTSPLNRDANDGYAPLLDRYNEILVEAAFSIDGESPTDYVPVFHGILGDSTTTEHDAEAGVVVHIQARDLAKRLQDDLIREPITYRDMYASEIIQALLDERFGEGAITLNGLGVDDFYIDEVTFEYIDTWQAIQSFCEQSDKDVRYMLDEGTGEFLLTYWTPSTAMVPVWSINASDIIRESLETSDASLRHGVEVRYIDANGERQSEYVEDLSNKKPNEPLRVALIEEGDTSAIRDQAAALRFANAVLSALKTVPATDSLQVPFTPYMRIYDVIQVANTGVRSEPELYAIDELRLNFSADEWWTEVVASESVKVRHEVWLEKEAKKGVKAPFTPADLATKRSVLTPEPGDWEVRRVAGGIEVRWAKPLTPYWDYTEVHLSRSSGFDPTGWDGSAWTSPPNAPGEFDGNTKTLIGTSKGQSLPITAGVVYRDTWYVKLVHVDTSGNRSSGNVTEKSISVGSPKGAVVVAASDANDFWKATADYICDGTDDQVEIAQALAGGGRVELSDGTFVVSARTLVGSGKSIAGQGQSTVIKLDNGVNSSLSIFDLFGTGGQSISSLVLDGNKSNQASGNQHGIAAANGCFITHVVVRDFRNAGIDALGVEGAVVSGNVFLGCQDGIDVTGGGDNRISNNECESNDRDGIRLVNASVTNTITGNVCRNNGNDGISVVGGQNVLSANTCKGNSRFGILMVVSSNNSVIGNTCVENGWSGIHLTSSNENTISSNDTSENGQYGISLSGSSGNTVTGNTCIANSQSANTVYDNIGLISDSSENNIQSNTCRKGSQSNEPGYGIHIMDSSCTGNMVTNNDLKDGGATGGLGNFGTSTVTAAGNRQ